MASKVRMADIAERLGISIVSVSKALGGKEGVSDELRAKVLTLAHELGYEGVRIQRPSLSVKNTIRNIGILVADRFFKESSFYARLSRALIMNCSGRGCSALIEIITPEAERECEMPQLIDEHQVDAVIFMGEISREYMRKIASIGLPYLLLDFYDIAVDAPAVISDSRVGAYRMAEYLLSLGYRRIAYVGSVTATSSIMDRYLGLCAALLKHGIEPEKALRIEDRDKDGTFIPLVLPAVLPDAFFCNCDEVAFRLMNELKLMGKNVPADVAVAGYDDFRYAAMCDPVITTYHVDVEGMAETAVKHIVSMLAGNEVPRMTEISGYIVRRNST